MDWPYGGGAGVPYSSFMFSLRLKELEYATGMATTYVSSETTPPLAHGTESMICFYCVTSPFSQHPSEMMASITL
eukprot:scaffold6485_cov116-Skeletonema_dohrnii-CCMP3373.AAC.13